MNRRAVLIDTGQEQIYLSDIKRYSDQGPKLWVYVRQDNEIYRAQESRKDLDVLLAFRKPHRSRGLYRHKHLIYQKRGASCRSNRLVRHGALVGIRTLEPLISTELYKIDMLVGCKYRNLSSI